MKSQFRHLKLVPATDDPGLTAVRSARRMPNVYRSGICIVLLFAILVFQPVSRAVRQARAIHAIQRLHGNVIRAPGTPGSLSLRTPGPLWLRKLIGGRWMADFGTVTEIQLNPSNLTNDDLLWLADIPTIKKLSFGRIFISHQGIGFMDHDGWPPHVSQITDQGMVALKCLQNLEELSLADTRVGDAGLRELSGLKKLQILGLDRTLVTDEGIQHLRPLQNLTLLSFRLTAVSDNGIAQLSMLPKLRSLYFERFVTGRPLTDDQKRAWESGDQSMLGGGVAELLKANPKLRVYWGPTSSEY